MKTHLALLLSVTSTALAQGPLTPPPGADPSIGPVNALTAGGLPQATMKTLHQVEPRTAIAGGTSGVTISASGAYYLTGNITVATGDGITINASHVTLDLNGFSITTSAAPAAGIGVRLGQGLRNVAIRNGNIGGDGLGGAFTGGVYYVVSGFPQPPSNLRVADLSVAAAEYGISTANSVATCHVERCLVIGGSVHGIQGGIVKDCVVEGGPILGRIVKDCSVTTPGTSGILAEVAENCYATSAGTAIQAKCLVNSYGTGGGNHDVISAGVVQNVWAEGGSGTGDGIEAKLVGNAYGKRVDDQTGGALGNGIKAELVSSSVGLATFGSGINSKTIGQSLGEGRPGIFVNNGGVVDGSFGLSTLGSGIEATSGIVSSSRGRGSFNGIMATAGIVSSSFAESVTNDAGATPLTGRVVTGSLGHAAGQSPISAIVGDLVAESVGLCAFPSPGSKGITATFLVQGVFGVGGDVEVDVPPAGKFHSN